MPKRNKNKNYLLIGLAVVASMGFVALNTSILSNINRPHKTLATARNRAQSRPNKTKGRILGASICDGSTDSGMCPITQANAPAANQPFTDPDFGSQIVRVTDQTIAPQGAHLSANSSGTVFNADSSMFLILYSDGSGHLFNIDPKTYSTKDLGALPGNYNYDGARWDARDPLILYALNQNARTMIKLKVVSTKPLRVQSDQFWSFISMPYSVQLAPQIETSLDGRYYAVIGNSDPLQVNITTADYDFISVFDSQKNIEKSLNMSVTFPGRRFDKIWLELSGRYVVLHESSTYGNAKTTTQPDVWYVWDTTTNSTDTLSSASDNDAINGQIAVGNGQILNIYNGSVYSRTFTDPHSPSDTLDFPTYQDKTDTYESSDISSPDGSTFYAGNYVSQTVDTGTAITKISQTTYAIKNYIAKSDPNILAPQSFRFGGVQLQQVAGIPSALGTWSYDSKADTLYVAPPVQIGMEADQNNPGQYTFDTRNSSFAFDWRPEMEEIIQCYYDSSASGDGTSSCVRLAHHRMSFTGDALATPHPIADPQNKYVLFNSNWGATLKNKDASQRTDVFLLIVPQQPAPTAQAPAANTPQQQTDPLLSTPAAPTQQQNDSGDPTQP